MAIITNYPYTSQISDSDGVFINSSGSLKQISKVNLKKSINADIDTEMASLRQLVENLYYKTGETFGITINTAGYCTANGTTIRFMIPLSKPIANGVSVELSNVSLILRQNGKNTHGSSAATGAVPISTEASATRSGIAVSCTMGDVTNAVNNDSIGINCNCTVAFS